MKVSFGKFSASLVSTLMDVEHVVGGEEGALQVVLAGGLREGHQAVHLRSGRARPVQGGAVSGKPLDHLHTYAVLRTQ